MSLQLGLAITHALGFNDFLGFGLFVVSCCPGGGGSNVWTVLLDGDLDLSMTLTFFSKTLALGMYLQSTHCSIIRHKFIIGCAVSVFEVAQYTCRCTRC